MTSPVEKAMQRNVTLTLYQTQDTELPLYPSAVDIVMRDVNTDALLGFMRLSRLCVEQDGAFYTVSSVASARGRQGLGYRLYLTAMAFVSQKRRLPQSRSELCQGGEYLYMGNYGKNKRSNSPLSSCYGDDNGALS